MICQQLPVRLDLDGGHLSDHNHSWTNIWRGRERETQRSPRFQGPGGYKKPQSETGGNERAVRIYPTGADEWEQAERSVIIAFSSSLFPH